MADNNAVSAVLIILITILCKPATHIPTQSQAPDDSTTNSHTVPPVGVFMIAGCGADLLINICLTFLGYAYPELTPVSGEYGSVLTTGLSDTFQVIFMHFTSNGFTLTAATKEG